MMQADGAVTKQIVLGIAGGSCSGKSTLAKMIKQDLASVGRTVGVVSLDAFYTRDLRRGPTLTLSDGITMFDFNHPDAIDADAAVKAIESAEEQVVIVEGLFTLAIDSIRSLVDVAVFVHLDADLRALRRLLRDMRGGRASRVPEFIARYYIESARIGHTKYVEPSSVFADLVAVGDDTGFAMAVSDIVARLGSPSAVT
ncbi:MAG: uridine kinase family protein [Fimbriimonadaceae bacterium]